ncbi:hypothetical protein EDB85DRAFT_1887968 [Lactarius pseudohatsudake]|nr:hypothetical protein EDB85DRAFT_1887968 [Lactarius pseudohatsudake]
MPIARRARRRSKRPNKEATNTTIQRRALRTRRLDPSLFQITVSRISCATEGGCTGAFIKRVLGTLVPIALASGATATHRKDASFCPNVVKPPQLSPRKMTPRVLGERSKIALIGGLMTVRVGGCKDHIMFRSAARRTLEDEVRQTAGNEKWSGSLVTLDPVLHEKRSTVETLGRKRKIY